MPLINAKFGDNGIMLYGREEDFDSAEMCIDIVQNGAIATGKVYAQPQKTGVLWDAYLVKPKFENLNIEILLYLTKCLEKSIQEKFSYDNKATWDRVKKEYVYLPSSDGKTPDTKYMESRIRELEEYLLASGLNDYQLTDDENKILKTTPKLFPFKITDIFTVLKGGKKLSQLDLSDEGSIPVYSSDTTNNGIIGYTKNKPDYEITEKTPIYLIFGDHTRSMNIATEDFCVADNVKVLTVFTDDIDVILYICTVWKKAIPNLGYARHWTVAKKSTLYLPVKENNIIDTDYIKSYINVFKKLTIKDVVDYKDMFINKTKEVIGNN